MTADELRTSFDELISIWQQMDRVFSVRVLTVRMAVSLGRRQIELGDLGRAEKFYMQANLELERYARHKQLVAFIPMIEAQRNAHLSRQRGGKTTAEQKKAEALEVKARVFHELDKWVAAGKDPRSFASVKANSNGLPGAARIRQILRERKRK